MSDENKPLPPAKGSRVRLREGYDMVYPRSYPGAEGIIDEYTIDPEKYERILVRWDKSHWRYNGERDMLTYLAHFEVIAPPELPEPVEELPEPAVNISGPPSPEALKRFLEAVGVDDEAEAPSVVDQFAEVLARATQIMADGTAFMLVTISPEPGGSGKLAPYFFSGMLDDESARAAQLAFTQIAGDVIKSLSFQFRGQS